MCTMLLTVVFLISCVKLLLIPAYHSTDFEVHRNWLAITHSLPINRWYYEDTSEWTLDYPPMFAWFEYLLSYAAKWFDVNMLNVKQLNYGSFNTILFQRLSVIFTDLILAYGIYQCSLLLPKNWKSDFIFLILSVTNVGLLMVDHVHFQYNGLMYGILLLSISKLMQQNYLHGAFLFAFLINMKHIYIYLAPAYFIYLLRNYCFNERKGKQVLNVLKSFSFSNTLYLGCIVLSVFFVTFAPFYNQLGQVLSRLFPFKRGLCHAYWAPNIWALYNVVDKFMALAASKLEIDFLTPTASMTGGLVQEYSHIILPNISPIISMSFTLIMMIPAMIKLCTVGPKPLHFIRCMVICALTSFIFGWHVHEKAILMAILPLTITAIIEPDDAKVFLILSTVGHYSLFPLLFPISLLLIKLVLFITYTTYAFYSLSKLYSFQFGKCTLPLLNLFETIYLSGLVPLFLYENVFHNILGFHKNLPFLPLMLTSVYCSFGVIYSWIKYYIHFLRRN